MLYGSFKPCWLRYRVLQALRTAREHLADMSIRQCLNRRRGESDGGKTEGRGEAEREEAVVSPRFLACIFVDSLPLLCFHIGKEVALTCGKLQKTATTNRSAWVLQPF